MQNQSCHGAPKERRLATLRKKPITSAADYWTRLNYGVAAVRVKKVCVVSGYVTHTFHLPLPALQTAQLDANRNSTCDSYCQKTKVVVDATRLLADSMKKAMTRMVAKIYNLVPDIDSGAERQRSNRAPLEFVGDLSSYLFGTATTADMQSLQDEIEKIKIVTGTVMTDASRTRNGLERYTQLQDERLDTMHEVMSTQEKSIEIIAKQIKELTQNTLHFEFNTMAFIAKELARFVDLHDSVQELELGVEELTQGQLTSKIISDQLLDKIFINISQKLEEPNAALCFGTAKEVYASKGDDRRTGFR
jgi:uncharacterized coiled-coil protein SlyX